MEQFCRKEVPSADTRCTESRELRGSALWIGMQLLTKYANWPLFGQRVRVRFSTFSAVKEAFELLHSAYPHNPKEVSM